MKKVFVALSGGVDSAVAAHKLKEEGWDVTGVFIRVWQPDFLPCSQDEEERAALRVAAHLGIPFQRIDLSNEYKQQVVDTMIDEYRAGRTPNPDVLCNSFIKFGAFLAYAKEKGIEKIATGHHARVGKSGDHYVLQRGVDSSKDQAYFLWGLSQDALARTLMPIGEMTKQEVREYAAQHNIPSALKPDSQGLCFIGHVDMRTFLKNFITTLPGNVLNEKGEVIGAHEGAELVTIGQRGGFTLTDNTEHEAPLYVISKDIETNTITVSADQEKTIAKKDAYDLVSTNWSTLPNATATYTCEIRYHGAPIPCTLHIDDSSTVVHLKTPTVVAKGQSIVVYDDEICLGGGIVA